ncbi:unnamed protein product [Calicophoron daubneyi]|uniref:PH domain-containing protein n=1 Tax=Calicophoron daubneyi TaxID=300641 RepID=A0AAV2SZB5_CALDB
MRDIIMCGFLVKSPPDVADNGKSGKLFRDLYCGGRPPRLLRKRWRERYCVLYKLRSQNKTEVYFEYYKDSNCLKLKGRVDLESCECIVHNAEVESWSNVFSIHTLYNQRRRIYYFAAPNPEIMSTWVQNLVTVTGFVDTTQPTLERRPTTTVPPLLSPRPSTTAAPNPSWVGRDSAAPLNRATGREGSTQPWSEEGYGDLDSAGVDYLMSGPEDDQDGYYKLPCSAHSYVNLSPQGDHENEVCSGDSAKNTRTSCPTLPARIPVTRPVASAENLTDAPPRPQKDGIPSGGEQPKESGTAQNGSTTESAQLGERRSSNNSVYFNVWESGHEEDTPCAKEPLPAQRKQQTMPPPAVSKRQQMPSYPARVYRRSQLVSDYHQLSAALPSQVPARRPVPAPLPAQKPVPPPRAPTTTTTTTSAIVTLPPSVPPTFGRAASVETCTDIPLPFRAPGLGNVADSSVESNSSCSSNSLLSLPSSEHNGDVDKNRELSTLRPPESSFSSGAPLEHAPPPPSTTTTTAATTTTISTTTCEGSPSSHLVTPNQNDVVLKPSASHCDSNGVEVSTHRPNQQLNYIEPCNLDLGTESANGPGSRTNHPVASSNVKGRVLTDHVRCVAPPEQTDTGNIPPLCARNLPSKRWATGTAIPNPTGATVTEKEDYKIEYKEIDPISTNALAVVTKRYLDDDTTT